MLIWNASASVSIGTLFRCVIRLGTSGRGDLVLVRPPQAIASFLEERGYLASSVPILKHVLALPGQSVCRSGRTIIVDEMTMGDALERDRRGRNLPVWQGCRIVGAGEVFLMNRRISWRLVRWPLLRPSADFDNRRSAYAPLDRKGLIVPVFLRQCAAQLKAIPHTSFPFPVICPADLQQPTVRLTTGRPLSLCGICAALLLGFTNVSHAQQDAAHPAGALAPADLTAGFVETASQRFAIPVSWIRAVLQAESGGVVHAVSPKGAMGLMQIMPDTWAELRSRYGLGPDPYDPHDNIMAGTAYLRELLDRYGEGGFLAAYNAGPSRYEEHLATGKPLPPETLAYMSAVTSLPDSASADGANSAASWTSSSLFVAKTSAGFTSHQPAPDKPEDRRDTNGIVLTATAHSPHSDGLFARKSDRTARPATSISLKLVRWRVVAAHYVSGALGRETPEMDGKGKAPPPDGRIWLVGLSFMRL